MSSAAAVTVATVKHWLVHQALLATPVPRLAAHFADKLLALGLPLWRAHVGVNTVHPQFESIGLTWTRQGKRQIEEFEHGSMAKVVNSSPFYEPITAAQMLARSAPADSEETVIPMTRYRLERGEGWQSSHLLGEFHAAGGTDYVCFVIVFGNDGRLGAFMSGVAVSFTGDRPGGFTDEEIAILTDLMPTFGAALRVGADLSKTRTLLETYLGRDVGRRVLSGDVRRGSVEAMSAAIVVGDLRGFTTLADEVPRDQLVSMLDDYLDCLVTPVEASNGHVLKFLGDGLLATFAFDDRDPQAVCGDALGAATAALQRIDALNVQRRRDGKPVMMLDLALHMGEVLYGNVGSDRRLDFTIVGPAVNEAARLEALCTTLDVSLVASRRFVDALKAPEKFRSLGPRVLRGVRTPVEVFTTV